jgi:riboflavin synthase
MAKLGISLPQGVEIEEVDFNLSRIFDSGIYPVVIKEAYTLVSLGGATQVVIETETMEGKPFRVGEYITAGKEKGYATTYEDSRTNKKVPLPGYTTINSISVLSAGIELSELETKTKVVEVYDFEERKLLPKEVQSLYELISKKVALGILKQIENKQQKADDGTYVTIDEVREINTINKVFNIEGFTLAEINNKLDDPKYIVEWKKINTGRVLDRSKKVAGNGARRGSPRTGSKDRVNVVSSLFNK